MALARKDHERDKLEPPTIWFEATLASSTSRLVAATHTPGGNVFARLANQECKDIKDTHVAIAALERLVGAPNDRCRPVLGVAVEATVLALPSRLSGPPSACGYCRKINDISLQEYPPTPCRRLYRQRTTRSKMVPR